MSNFRKNTLGMLGIAAFTMVASMALLSPGIAGASDEDPSDTPKNAEDIAKVAPYIAVPKYEDAGCTVTLKADKESYALGEKPVLTVVVKNDSDKPVEKTIVVCMTGRSLLEMSRLPARPVELFKDTRKVTLKAGESKTITIETNTAIPEHQAIAFQFGGVAQEEDVDSPRPDVERPVAIRN